MTEQPPSDPGAALTDRARLAGSAYRTGAELSARQGLYAWQTPRYDLPGLVVERLAGVTGVVVDVGCGNGRAVARIARDRPELRVVGLDVSPGILAGIPVPVLVADAARLPLADGCAGAVLALHMLYHVADIAAALRGIARVLRPGGTLVVSTNGAHDKRELDDLWRRAAADVLGTDDGPSRISLSSRFTLEAAPGLLAERFGRVSVVELPGVIRVTSPDPVVAHLASYRAWADQHDVPFGAVVARAGEIVRTHLATHPTFDITCLGGILTCHR